MSAGYYMPYHVPSTLEKELIEIIRTHRTVPGDVFKALYPPQTDYCGEENRSLAIALANIKQSGRVAYTGSDDMYKATILDDVNRRRLKIIKFYLKLSEGDENRTTNFLYARRGRYHDLEYPTEDGYNYLLYVDNTASATKVKHLVETIKDHSDEVDDIKIILIVLNKKDLKFCKTDDIPSIVYMTDGEELKEV